MRSIRPQRLAPGVLLLSGALLFLAGCSGGNPTGTVTGTVKYKGAPLTAGTVNFHGTKGTGSQGTIDTSGNFTLAGSLEVGTYKVYINPPVPEPAPPGTPPKKVAKLDIPPKYMDLGQTPVSRDVKAGPNTFAIDLE